MDIQEQTIQYIKMYGQSLIEEVTLISENTLTSYRNIKSAFRIQIEVLEGPSTLIVGLPYDFPSSLPHFYDSQFQFQGIPHLEENGFICFTHKENLIIDERYPGQVVLDCLKKVINILEAGEAKLNNHEFLEEFEAYWARASTLRNNYIMIDEKMDTVRELDVYIMKKDNMAYFICEKNYNPDHYLQTVFHQNRKELIKKRCIYIPLQQGSFIIPPKNTEFWDLNTFKNFIMNNINPANQMILQKLLSRIPKSNHADEHMCISLPINSEKAALFGVTIHCPEGMITNRKMRVRLHPFIQAPPKINLTPFYVKRLQKEFLLERTGSDSGFAQKTAVVVGVGAIGSVVAVGLAKAGFQKITLIDDDSLDADNVYRHELGMNSLFSVDDKHFSPEYKVDALKKEIQSRYPSTQVNTFSKKISTVITENELDWEDINFVVVCIGVPNVEMSINKYMHQLEKAPIVIYSWVEPFGIGSHVLVTLNKEKNGCYQCLFRPIDDEPIRNLSSFVKTGQTFTRSLGGCGTYFTPYSFLDSEETANRILRTLYKIDRNQLEGNPMLSWKGDPASFIDQGFQVSDRYMMTEEQLMSKQLLYQDPNCPICAKNGATNDN